MQSKATSVADYLKELAPERRTEIEKVRAVVLKHMDPALAEGMTYGMIGYFVPHSTYPAGYHCDPRQPLPYAGLASQKQYMSLYLMPQYCGRPGDANAENDDLKWFKAAWAKTGKKLDMGKCCIRFQKADDLALDVIAESLRRTTVKKWIAQYESVLTPAQKAKAAKAAAARTGEPANATKQATKKVATKAVTKKVTKKAAKKTTKKPTKKAAK